MSIPFERTSQLYSIMTRVVHGFQDFFKGIQCWSLLELGTNIKHILGHSQNGMFSIMTIPKKSRF